MLMQMLPARAVAASANAHGHSPSLTKRAKLRQLSGTVRPPAVVWLEVGPARTIEPTGT